MTALDKILVAIKAVAGPPFPACFGTAAIIPACFGTAAIIPAMPRAAAKNITPR